MKSIAVSVMWPAWFWTFAPHIRFLTASYGASLAERDAIRSRDLLRSVWYHERWPELELKADVNRTNRYENTHTGYRLATSVGGEATGEGGDVIIVDDPHKLEEAMSDSARARVLDWHDGTLASRFNDPKTRNRGRRHAAPARARPLRPPARARRLHPPLPAGPLRTHATPSSGPTTPGRRKANCSGRRTSPSRH